MSSVFYYFCFIFCADGCGLFFLRVNCYIDFFNDLWVFVVLSSHMFS